VRTKIRQSEIESGKAPPTIGGTEEVAKHNNAIHVSGELSLIERKLINVLLLNAFKDLGKVKTHQIAVPFLCELIGWENSGNMGALKKALKRIMTTSIEFDLLNRAGKPAWDATTPLAYAGIVDGVCRYEYSDFLAQKLKNPDMYSKIHIGVQREFNGAYSLTLYENCVRFRETGSTGWFPVETWRKVLGAEAAVYDTFKFLSSKVIKPAVKEIFDVSDIIVEPEYRREGRFVKEIRFSVRENPQGSIFRPMDADSAKETAAYKLLMSLEVGEALALSLVRKDEQRAMELALYVKEKYEKGEIKISTGGYLRQLDKDRATVKKPAKPAPASTLPAPAVPPADTGASKTQEAFASLLPAERAALAAEFIAQAGSSATYDAEKDRVGALVETRQYKDYARSRAVAIVAARVG
jgi:hypothetical protein